MYTLHMFEDIKKRISVRPAFYVSFMYLLLCVYDNGSTGLLNAIYSHILYIYCTRTWQNLSEKCTFPKMCANIRTDYQCAVRPHF